MKILDAPTQILNVTSTISQCQRHQLRQPIYQVRQTETKNAKQNAKYVKQKPNTPNKTPSSPAFPFFSWSCWCNWNIKMCFVAKQFCCKFTHFFAYFLQTWKIWWRTKNDKYQVWTSGTNYAACFQIQLSAYQLLASLSFAIWHKLMLEINWENLLAKLRRCISLEKCLKGHKSLGLLLKGRVSQNIPIGYNIWWENRRNASFGPKNGPKLQN